MPEIQKADPQARRLAIWIVAGGALAGTLLLVAADGSRAAFAEWVTVDPLPRLKLVVILMMMLTVAPALAMAVYVWRIGSETIAARRFPAPGRRLTRDTPVLVGDAATRRGRLLQGLAALLAAGSAALGVLLWRLVELVERIGPSA